MEMKMLEKYPIYIDYHEQEIIMGIIADQKHKIPNVWQQLIDRKIDEQPSININAYELGFLTASVEEQRHKVPIIWKQLMDMMNKFREDAGVKMIDLGNGMVQLIDDQGETVVREKYKWEI